MKLEEVTSDRGHTIRKGIRAYVTNYRKKIRGVQTWEEVVVYGVYAYHYKYGNKPYDVKLVRVKVLRNGMFRSVSANSLTPAVDLA